MSELQKLVEADHRFEEATEMLRDLLDDKVWERLSLAMEKSNNVCSREAMEATLLLLDWLFVEGQEHLDAMLADIHDIDLAKANRGLVAAAFKAAKAWGMRPTRLPRVRDYLAQARAVQGERCGHA